MKYKHAFIFPESWVAFVLLLTTLSFTNFCDIDPRGITAGQEPYGFLLRLARPTSVNANNSNTHMHTEDRGCLRMCDFSRKHCVYICLKQQEHCDQCFLNVYQMYSHDQHCIQITQRIQIHMRLFPHTVCAKSNPCCTYSTNMYP